MVPPPRLTFRVEAGSAGIRQAAGELDAFGAAHGLPGDGAWPLQLALDEVLSNIGHHGSAGPEATTIEVAIEYRDGALELTVSDDGPAFDPLQLPEPDVQAPLEKRDPGGLGIHLVRRLMDRVEYKRDGGRNHLTMTWKPTRVDPRGA